MKFYLEKTDAVLNEVGSGENGLSSQEASERLEKNGKNKLVEGKKDSLIVRFLKQLAEPMTIILLVAAAIAIFAINFLIMKNPSARYLSGIFDPSDIPPEQLSPSKKAEIAEKEAASDAESGEE